MTRTRAFSFAVAAVLGLAQPMFAQAQGYRAHDYRSYDRYADDCSRRVRHNGTTGALLGAAAGAVLGSNVASRRNHTEGALIGAAAGAAVGSNIARSSTKDRCSGSRYRAAYPAYSGYYQPGYTGYYEPGYTSYEPRHDNGLHRGWYKHHHEDDDDGDD